MIKRSVLLLVGIILVVILNYYDLLPKHIYYNQDFGIENLLSSVDYNQNGIDDYADLVNGARKDAKKRPKYDSAYYVGGYPPENRGVCTDLVWRAFREAGYSLKDMINEDIAKYPQDYAYIEVADPNIDFRRVINLIVFFEKYGVVLTTDTKDIAAWQAGDIVIFGDDRHIGIVSDKRDRQGFPYILHNSGQLKREEDYLRHENPTAHYRFDASQVPQEVLIAFSGE